MCMSASHRDLLVIALYEFSRRFPTVMTTAAQPTLQPGKVYRPAELATWSANPTRLAARLVERGELVRLRHGLYLAPHHSRFGLVPPSDTALLDALLDGSPYLITGPPRWNALGLGTTAVFATTLVYNTLRSGRFDLAGRRFQLRRTRFPEPTTPEWFVIDLLNNAQKVGMSADVLAEALTRAVRARRFDLELLNRLAKTYSTRVIQKHIATATQL